MAGILPVVAGTLAVDFDEIDDGAKHVAESLTLILWDITLRLQPIIEVPFGRGTIASNRIGLLHLPEISVVGDQNFVEQDFPKAVSDPNPQPVIVSGGKGERPLQTRMVEADFRLERVSIGKVLIFLIDVVLELNDLLHEKLCAFFVHLALLVEKGRCEAVDPIRGCLQLREYFRDFL